MQGQFKNVKISGIASAVPAVIKSLEEAAIQLNLSDFQVGRMKKDLGIGKRHVVNSHICASDLCRPAVKALLSELEYDPATIDAMIMVTQTPDYFQPATSCVLHGRLGLAKSCATFDINLGCSGYVYGLWLGSMIIHSGNAKRVLLLAGDTLSRCVSSSDRTVVPLFGDAGSATMIEEGANDSEMTFALHSDGTGYKHLVVPAGAFRKRLSVETTKQEQCKNGSTRSEEYLYMNGAEIFNFSIREVPPLVEEVLAVSGLKKEEVDYFIFHQANKFVISNIARMLGIPIEKAPFNVFERYDNQSSASIPVTLCEDLNTEVRKNKKKVVLAGFGTGLSWAACAMSLGPAICSPVVVLDE